MKTLFPTLPAVLLLLLASGRSAAQHPMQQTMQQPIPQAVQQPVQPASAIPTTAAPKQAGLQQAALPQQPVGTTAPQPVTAQYALTLSAADSVPQQTIVPVQQAPVQIDETTTYYAVAPQIGRAERRRLQARDFAARIDSLIRSHSYFLRARTMRELPAGCEHRIYADFYYCAVAADHIELHLPIEQGSVRRLDVLNFDSMTLRDYRASRLQSGWEITFDLGHDDEIYHIELFVSTTTGEAQLTLVAPRVTMRYTGGLQG